MKNIPRHDPDRMIRISKKNREAVLLLKDKIKGQMPIRVIGDYDADGICSSYILKRGLEACGAVVDTMIPHRMKDGYGLNEHLVDEAYADGIDTILTCDNGIAAYAQIEQAKKYGMTVIITDLQIHMRKNPCRAGSGNRRDIQTAI
ncbi:MAG: DHH family phosphoesterase [Gallintestinimicrobium sp.]